MRLVKNKTSTIIENSTETLSFSSGTVEPHNITTVKCRNDIGLEVEQKKGFRKKP